MDSTVATYLGTEFEHVANSLLERATGAPQEGATSSQETARYDKLMKSLRLVGDVDAEAVFRKLWSWRKNSLAKTNDSSGIHLVVIESTFLEASVQLLEDKTYGCETVLRQYTEEVERIVFKWVLTTEQGQIHSGMTQFRRNIDHAAARIIGSLARGRLEAVSALLFKEISSLLKAELTYRPAFISLCNAMKNIKLTFESDNDFAASLNLIEHSDPLKNYAVFKPSQARHCLSSMMSSWLHPMAISGIVMSPPFHADQEKDPQISEKDPFRSETLRSRFFERIDIMQENLRQWAEEKNKHILDVYPLIVDLWCLQAKNKFLERGEKVLKMLKKALKTKDHKCLAVRCMTQCAKIAIWRLSSSQKPSDYTKLIEWLNRISRDVVFNTKRTVSLSPELQDLTVRLCVTIGHYHSYSVGSGLIMPFLQHEQYDKVTVALRSLLELMFTAVVRLNSPNGTSSTKEIPIVREQLVSLERNDMELQLLEYIRSGKQGMTLINFEEKKSYVAKELGKILRAFESINLGGTNGAKGNASNENTKELLSALTKLAWCFRCIPYVLPSEYKTAELIHILARYTCNEEPMISSVAIRSLKHILLGIPSLRIDVLYGLASFIVSISDEKTTIIKDGLWNLHDLLLEWLNHASDSVEGGSTPPSSVFKVQSLEGIILCFFCSAYPEIRKLASEILSTIRSLHKTLSKSSQDTINLDSPNLKSPFSSMMYVMDVLEEMGSDIAQRVYWDSTPWSDLCRRWKPVPENVTLADLMYGSNERGLPTDRWAKCLCEIATEGPVLCPEAFDTAYIEVSKKLYQMTKQETNGRVPIEMNDLMLIDHFRNYCCFACACPPKKSDSVSDDAFHVHALHQLLVNLLSGGSLYLQDIAVSALGCCNAKSYHVLAKELQGNLYPSQSKEKSRNKQTGKAKMEEKLNIANVFRLVADRMPRGILSCKQGLRAVLMASIDWCLSHIDHGKTGTVFDAIASLSVEYDVQDVLQFCYCLCSTVANAAAEITTSIPSESKGFSVQFRQQLFEVFQQLNAPGKRPGKYEAQKEELLNLASNRLKDSESLKARRAEWNKCCEYLEVISRIAMVALLQGPHWDTDGRTNSPVFNWIDYLLAQEKSKSVIGPSNSSIARQALIKMITSNMSLIKGYIDKCYDVNPKVASIYFQVVCEVYCSHEVQVKVHIIVSLVLYKCVDPDQQVREDALHLLWCLKNREWQGKCTTGWALCLNGNSVEDNVIVIGSLQDSCQSSQYQLSESLAREHSEINAELCEELMTRQCNEVVNQGVLLCLIPWMEQLSFCSEDSQWSLRLLKSMYYITSQHGKQFRHEIERLWSTVANNKSNIRPILDFLVTFGVDECAEQDADPLLEFFSVFKRISLYLSRASPHRTITYLVTEAGKLIQFATPAASLETEKQDVVTPLKFSSSSPSKSATTKFLKSQLSLSSQREVGGLVTGLGLSVSTAAGGTGIGASVVARFGEVTTKRPPSFTSVGICETVLHHRERNYTSNISMSMQSDGSFDESCFIKADGITQTSRKSISNLSALGSDRKGSEIVVPSLKGLLQKSEFALCLLSEIAYEQGDEFQDHLPLLFHICVICMDSLEAVVRLHSQQLIIHLLNVLMSKRVGVPGKANKLSALMSALKSMKGEPPWPYEDTNLAEGQVLSEDTVSFFVSGLLEATCEGSNLKDLWIQEALTWAVESTCRHLSCRSFQVLRGLNPQASSEAFISLVRCLKECFVNPSLTAMECVLEILETMKMLMYNAEGTKLVLYPQLFWVCISLLSSDYIHIYRLALELLYRLLESLRISDDIILNVLLATTPTSIKYSPVVSAPKRIFQEGESSDIDTPQLKAWDLGTQILLPSLKAKEHPVLCVQHLLVKGLYSIHTEAITIKLLKRLAGELTLTPEMNLNSSSCLMEPKPHISENCGVSVLLGSVQIQIAVMLAAVIPWTCTKILAMNRTEGVLEVCCALAEACNSEGHNTVGSSLMNLFNADQNEVQSALDKVADALYAEIKNEYKNLMVGYWLGFLQSKDQSKIYISLLLLRAIFERCKDPTSLGQLQSSSMGHESDFSVFSLISSHLQGSNSVEASKVLLAMVTCHSKNIKPENNKKDNNNNNNNNSNSNIANQESNEVLSEALKRGIELHTLIAPDHQHITNTILGVLETCPQHLKKPSGKEFMPFLREQSSMN